MTYWIPIIIALLAVYVAVLQARSMKEQAIVSTMTLVIEDLTSKEARDDRWAIFNEDDFKGQKSAANFQEIIEQVVVRMDKAGYLLLVCAGVDEKPSRLSKLYVRKEPPQWIWEMTNKLWVSTSHKVLELREQRGRSQYGRYFEKLANAAKLRQSDIT